MFHLKLCSFAMFLILSSGSGNAQLPVRPSPMSPVEMNFGKARKGLTDAGYLPQGKDLAKLGIKSTWTLADFIISYVALSHLDKLCEDWADAWRNPHTPAGPLGTSQENSCFAGPYGALNKTRLNLERLRCISTYNEDFVKKSIAFGDSASGISPITGLAWNVERLKIEESEKYFHDAYDKKYVELIQHLQEELNQINSCEEQVYGNKNWYNRFGFIYYTLMSDRYKR